MLAIFVTVVPAAPVTVPEIRKVTVLLTPTTGTVTPVVSTESTVVAVAGVGHWLPALATQVTVVLMKLLTAGSEKVSVVAATLLVLLNVIVYCVVPPLVKLVTLLVLLTRTSADGMHSRSVTPARAQTPPVSPAVGAVTSAIVKVAVPPEGTVNVPCTSVHTSPGAIGSLFSVSAAVMKAEVVVTICGLTIGARVGVCPGCAALETKTSLGKCAQLTSLRRVDATYPR